MQKEKADPVKNPQDVGLDPGRGPDYRIEGYITDCYAPWTADFRSIWTEVKGKADKRQAFRVIVNATDSKGNIPELIGQFKKWKITNLQQVVVQDGRGNFIQIFPTPWRGNPEGAGKCLFSIEYIWTRTNPWAKPHPGFPACFGRNGSSRTGSTRGNSSAEARLTCCAAQRSGSWPMTPSHSISSKKNTGVAPSVEVWIQPDRERPASPQEEDIVVLAAALLDDISADMVLAFNFETAWLIRRGGDLILHESPSLWPERRLSLIKEPYRRESHHL
ncbi:SitI3 family protein [Kitasatospora sp. NPDC088391]|uniref:SitI3 family protein n=1 Tax=Kitasatospora sp. NPDC088391 TaxID=3364074 RepID=UPI0037F63A32